MFWLKQRQFGSKDAAVRRKAMQQLSESPTPRALEVLRHALDDEDDEVRRLAVTALSKLDDERRLDPLIIALRDRDPEVLKAAISAVKRFNEERVQAALVPLIFHADAGVRGHAAQLLDGFAWRPTKPDEQIWHAVARNQYVQAAAHGVAALPALECVLNSGPYTARVAAIEALATIDDKRALRPLLGALQSIDPAVCGAAVEALANLGDPESIAPIIEVLRHPGDHPRATAAEALGRLNAIAAIEPLRVLLHDPNWHVRQATIEALSRLKDHASIPEIARHLHDDDPDVREATALALGNMGDRQAIGPLIEALKDSSSVVRRIATTALARIDEAWSSSGEAQEAVEELKSSLDTKDPDVRYLVEKLLSSVGHQEAAPSLPRSGEALSVGSLDKRRKLAVSLFMAILCDEDRDLRQAAAESLGRLGDDRAEAALARVLGDDDPIVRHSAAAALEALSANRPPA